MHVYVFVVVSLQTYICYFNQAVKPNELFTMVSNTYEATYI